MILRTFSIQWRSKMSSSRNNNKKREKETIRSGCKTTNIIHTNERQRSFQQFLCKLVSIFYSVCAYALVVCTRKSTKFLFEWTTVHMPINIRYILTGFQNEPFVQAYKTKKNVMAKDHTVEHTHTNRLPICVVTLTDRVARV